jgi:hypothetical protein
MATAASKLGRYVKGRFRGIDVTRRGESPRVVYADVVGSGGRVRVTGSTLRSIFGLNDTWATYNVISASGKVTNPKSSETDPGTGSGSGSGGSETGGASPGRQAHAAARPHGTIAGHVGWVERPTRVTLQRREGDRWVAAGRARTASHGAYRFHHLPTGRYRIWWRSTAGPTIDLRQ